MRIDLTPEQADELSNSFWSIDYTVTLPDGTEEAGNTGDDDLRELPEGVLIGELGVITDDRDRVTGYVISHPALTWEDEVILKHVLDERVAAMAKITALPREERAEARQELRRQLRQEARRDARREARRLARREDRQEARRLMRQALREDSKVDLEAAKAKGAEEEAAARAKEEGGE